MKAIMKFILILILTSNLNSHAQKTNLVVPPKAVLPVPSEKQLAWHELEQYAFVHFTTNTFTGKEWGFGDESPSIFNPSEVNTEQWAKVIKEAGLKGLVFTCKHHDGFCLWPSKYTEHSVKNSPWRNGKGDLVREVSDACKKYKLKFGIYLSPWDRNSALYGTPAYVEYYRNQLKELFTQYGPAFEMWFDGANGGDGYYGGAREKRKIDAKTYYDWPTTLNGIRKMDSNVLFFSGAGPDIRWVGNEEGFAGKTNWATMNLDTIYPGIGNKMKKTLNEGDIKGDKWVPSEVDVSIRPGWFYHENEDVKVKTPEQLFKIYMESVGRGSNLILNLAPDKRGLIPDVDVKSMQGYKKLLDERFKTNYALHSKANSKGFRGNSEKYSPKNLVDGNKETYWATDDNVVSASAEIVLKEKKNIKFILLQEYIRLGQRVKSFSIEVWKDNSWQKVAQETTIGYKRILQLDSPVETNKIRVTIIDSKACPLISNFEVY